MGKEYTIEPLFDQVLIEREEKGDHFEAGGEETSIEVPAAYKDKRSDRGTVLAVGKGKVLPDGSRLKPTVEPGDNVIFPEFAGTDVEIMGREFRLIYEPDILAIVREVVEESEDFDPETGRCPSCATGEDPCPGCEAAAKRRDAEAEQEAEEEA